MPVEQEPEISKIIEHAVESRRRKAEAHRHSVLNSEEYIAQQKRLQHPTANFAYAAEFSGIAFTRYPHSRNWLLSTLVDELQESAYSIYVLMNSGVFHSGQRELRYMVECATKYVYVDQALPGGASLEERELFLHHHVPKSSVSPIEDTTLRMVPAEDFKAEVKSAFKALSSYVHPSRGQLHNRRKRLENGEGPGFESIRTLEHFVNALSRVYDLVLALVFEGVGPSFTGDVFIQILDDRPEWKFHRTKYCKIICHHFNYKLERQDP